MLHGKEGAGATQVLLRTSHFALSCSTSLALVELPESYLRVHVSLATCLMQVKDHARQLLEKYIGKPFLDAKYAGKAARMEAQDVEEGLQWLEERFHVVRCEDDELPSVDWVLGLARAAVLRCFC